MDKIAPKCYTKIKRYEELTIANDFMFCKIFQKPELCKQALECILQKKLKEITCTNAQQVVDTTIDGKSIRLDIMAVDEKGVVYDIEMQCADTKELPQRSRFYRSMIDQDLLDKGQRYFELSNSIVIFVCPFDLFKKGFGKYTFRLRADEDTSLLLNDGSSAIFLNTTGKVEDSKLQNFLDYLNGNETVNDHFVRQLKNAMVKASQNSKWRDEYMRISAREQYNEYIYTEKGRQEEKRTIILKALEENSPEKVATFLKLPLSEVLSIYEKAK